MVPSLASPPLELAPEPSLDALDAPFAGGDQTTIATVAVVGLGYVGLPTGLALHAAGFELIGVDASERRLRNIRQGSVDLLPRDRVRLAIALDTYDFELSATPSALARAEAILICVPTPVDADRRPDTRSLRAACAEVVSHAREGQLIVLTSTTYVGSTRELLIEPLREAGLEPGEQVFVAFAPERIDPGNADHTQEAVPRVVGAATPRCARFARALLEPTASGIHLVSSPEVAELTKLYENSFRAVNIAFANEMATIARRWEIDPIELTEAAATKPYGYMPFFPGAGVGGHCVPCDPHYLLDGVNERGGAAPLLSRAMDAIAGRPAQVARRAIDLLSDGQSAGTPHVLLVGAAYKPGVSDVREAPSIEILRELVANGIEVSYHDPLVRSIELGGGLTLLSVDMPEPADYDLAIAVTLHPGHHYGWLEEFPAVLDCTYRGVSEQRRVLV